MKAATKQMQASEMKDSTATNVVEGDVFTTSSGVTLVITRVEIGNLHLGKPSIWISYDYDDNGRRGDETVSLTNFQNNLAS